MQIESHEIPVLQSHYQRSRVVQRVEREMRKRRTAMVYDYSWLLTCTVVCAVCIYLLLMQ